MISSKSNYNPTIGAKKGVSRSRNETPFFGMFNSIDNHSATIWCQLFTSESFSPRIISTFVTVHAYVPSNGIFSILSSFLKFLWYFPCISSIIGSKFFNRAQRWQALYQTGGDMDIVCLDLEGVLVPEIWIAFAEETGIPELKRTTRDEPDYNKLMN